MVRALVMSCHCSLSQDLWGSNRRGVSMLFGLALSARKDWRCPVPVPHSFLTSMEGSFIAAAIQYVLPYQSAVCPFVGFFGFVHLVELWFLIIWHRR